MRKGTYNKGKIVIVEADEGKYLIPKNLPENLNLEDMGKPTQIIFDNSGIIPEFEERDL